MTISTKDVCQLDAELFFVGVAIADLSPLEENVWLIPGGCIDVPAPVVPAGKRAKWNGAAFELWDLPADPVAPPVPPPTLDEAKAAQITLMAQTYAQAIAQDLSITTAAGVTKTFQANAQSVANAQAMIAAFGASGVPAGFYWVSSDNTQVPFTLADLQGLAKAMGDQGWAAFQQLQDRKASILAATTIAAAQAVTWVAPIGAPAA